MMTPYDARGVRPSAKKRYAIRVGEPRVLMGSTEFDAVCWLRLKYLAREFPHISISHGDGSDLAHGFKGWDCEIITGLPGGAIIVDNQSTLEDLIVAVEDKLFERAVLKP